ncbi:MAG: hypothetical protein AVDCRST_MAG22-447, partial [uncultured Rubrobacteraceae bacterium]
GVGPPRLPASWEGMPGVPRPLGTMLRGEPRGGGSIPL